MVYATKKMGSSPKEIGKSAFTTNMAYTFEVCPKLNSFCDQPITKFARHSTSVKVVIENKMGASVGSFVYEIPDCK